MLNNDEHDLKEYNSVIANNLWVLLRKKSITPKRLALYVGVSEKRIYSLLKPYSTANVTTLTILRIERYFGLEKGGLLKENK